jgi:uncharacterized protein (TIGR02217 family)
MAEFLEERLAMNIDKKSSWGESYEVEVTETDNGNEYRRLLHPYPRLRYDVSYELRDSLFLLDRVIDLYHRCYGKYAGFRVLNLSDHSTNNHNQPPTNQDETLTLISTGVYQMIRTYGDPAKPVLAIGRPKRTIFKPVSGSTLISINNVNVPLASAWTISTTTGIVAFDTNKMFTVTGITKAASAVVTIGSHNILINETVHFSGIVGMTQINGLRGLVTAVAATTITVNIDSTLFTTWAAGGTQQVNTRPQSGEVVKGGCYFDIPMRWDSDISQVTFDDFDTLGLGKMEIVELLNP